MNALSRTNPNPDSILRKSAFEISKALDELCVSENDSCGLVAHIEQTEPIRNCYLDLVERSIMNDVFSGDKIGTLIETIYNGVSRSDFRECYHFFWDVFISTTALMIGYEKYGDLHKLLHRTYFLRDIIGTDNDPTPYTFSRFRQHCHSLEGECRQKINPRLLSLAADILVKREHGQFVNKRTLVTADTTLAHLAKLYGQAQFTWYPALAPYSHCAGSSLIWERLVSKSFCEKLYPLFDVSTFQDFRQIVKKMSDEWDSDKGMQHMGAAFGGIYPVLLDGGFEKVGTLP